MLTGEDLPPMQEPLSKLKKPFGFFMTHSWWWTPENKYEYNVPQADFDWLAAHGNGAYVAEQLTRPAVVDYGIAFVTAGGDNPWYIPDDARANLKAALSLLTPEQAKMILAFVLVDEPDIRNVNEALFEQALKITREVSLEVLGFSPPVLISYSYTAFQTKRWPCFALADYVAFDYHPVSYASGGLNNASAVSPLSWNQMLVGLHTKMLPHQKLVVIVETATTKPELTWLMNSNLWLTVEAIRPIAKDVAFIVGFNYQGLEEDGAKWIGANKLPDLLWRYIL